MTSTDTEDLLEQWLSDAPLPANRQKETPDNAPETESQSYHIFYVFLPRHPHGMELELWEGYVRKNGMLGTQIKRLNRRNSSFRKGYHHNDNGILTKLSSYGRTTLDFDTESWRGQEVFRYEWPHGEEMTDLIRAIVQTGRARAYDVFSPQLQWTEEIAVTPVWVSGKDRTQQIIFKNSSDKPVEILKFPTPMAYENSSQTVGPVKAEYPPHILRWLASAPPAAPREIEQVIETLESLDPGIPLPSLNVLKMLQGKPTPHLKLFGHTPDKHLHRSIQFSTNRFISDYLSRPIHPQSIPHVSRTYPCIQLNFCYSGAPEPVRSNTLRTNYHSDFRKVLPDIDIKKDKILEVIMRNRTMEIEYVETLDSQLKKSCTHDLLVNLSLSIKYCSEADEIDYLLPDNISHSIAPNPALQFWFESVPELKSKGWVIEVDDSWPVRFHEGTIDLSTSLESTGNDWFTLSLKMSVDEHEIDLVPMISQFLDSFSEASIMELSEDADAIESIVEHVNGQTYYPQLPDGSMISLDGSRLAPFITAFLEAKGILGFHLAESSRMVPLVQELEGCGIKWKAGKELIELSQRLQALVDTPDVTPPSDFDGSLRHYQQEGYGWLKALAATGFGGALADDMGLGKTIQALAILSHRHLEEKTDRPSLIVVPTSLIGNWQRETKRFCPDLKMLLLHGPDRKERFTSIPDHHLVLTTYPLINRDHETLFEHEFDYAILDEAQNVKNPAAGITKNIRGIKARQRLALTGTPIENNLGELWALYDWLIPGLLGNRKFFNQNFRTPIEKHGDSHQQKILSTKVKPFLLRRTKEEVEKELPTKSIIDDVTPLEPDQGALYEGIRAAMDKRVREAIASRGLAQSRITILDALLKLRQVCCDPKLVKLSSARKVKSSAKRTRLLELLEELVLENRKVLVFSQFVEMLRLIEEDVKRFGWDYSMLHGGTDSQMRDSEIQRFQNGDTPIFLISLKAGGTGLNLTAADTVIIYDPWWNPAVERQAMDRAHRIGQNKPVFVHRLIAEGTVEATIQEMQKRKQALADALFEGTGKGPLALSEKDLDTLFGAD